MRLEEVLPGQRIYGVSEEPFEVVQTTWLGADYLNVVCRSLSGEVYERLLGRDEEQHMSLDGGGADFLGGDAARWKEATEAFRLRHAALIDPMLAVSHSALQPLPHQIHAVYGEFLPRTPLRYLLADDPGAGKTIMCGLYIKEMILRGDLDRCLIVAPGGLVDQWHDELWTKFGLDFRILSRDLVSSVPGNSVFEEFPLLIARMDALKNNEELQELLGRSEWDLIVVDEAHRMSARWIAGELEPTKRYSLGKLLGAVTRHFLLMTATPHTGDPGAFQAFLALLDEDRFVGEPRDGRSVVPGADVMRRMLKEELLTMEGKPLFPERKATTVTYSLSPREHDLYDEVGEYVRNEMNRVQRLRAEGEGKRANTVGFALTVLQRRLASSPEAILRSLERRKERLERRRDGIAADHGAIGLDRELAAISLPENLDTDEVEVPAAESERTEETLVDAASAAQTRAELDLEISALARLVEIAADVRARDTDSKWIHLRSILEEEEITRDAEGRPRKIIIFSEHRDTLRYLGDRIRALPGRADGVVEIHGGLSREQRLQVQKRFTHDPKVSVLVATDAAGEGLNLQCANLMVNYDLPWNPNRLEQRFGRIHRIGQTEVCHLWNLVARDTREGEVFFRLLSKMEEQAIAYEGKVFDVLGEAFADQPLRDLLLSAILEGDDPAVRARLNAVIDETVSEGVPELVQRRAMYSEVLQQVDVAKAQEKADIGARGRMQPHFTASWFEAAFPRLGGRVRRRGDAVEIPFVPADLVAAATRGGAGTRVANQYTQATFDPTHIDSLGASGRQVIGPGHPLMDTVADTVLRSSSDVLHAGTVLIDPRGRCETMRVFAAISHEVTNGGSSSRVLSHEVAFVEIDEHGHGEPVGPSYLDYRPATDEERARIGNMIETSSLADPPDLALKWTMREVVPAHLAALRETHGSVVERARAEVEARLRGEVAHWRRQRDGSRWSEDQIDRRLERLESRLALRLRELDADAHVVPGRPRILTVALVVPAGLLQARGLATSEDSAVLTEAVMDAERGLGRTPELVAAWGGGGAVKSRAESDLSVWIDVHAYDQSERSLTVSRTDVLHARNLGDRYRLALVQQAAGGATSLRYVRDPFARVRVEDFHQHEFALPVAPLWRAGTDPF